MKALLRLAIALVVLVLVVLVPDAVASGDWYELGVGESPIENLGPIGYIAGFSRYVSDSPDDPVIVPVHSLRNDNVPSGFSFSLNGFAYQGGALSAHPWSATSKFVASTDQSFGDVDAAWAAADDYAVWSDHDGNADPIHVVHNSEAGSDGWQDITAPSAEGAFSSDASAAGVSIAALPYYPAVAYTENDETGHRIVKVKQLTGPTWSELGPGARIPVTDVGTHLDLAEVGGTPYVAFEAPGTGNQPQQIRVAKFDTTTFTWSLVGGSLNHDPDQRGNNPSIADIGGVPYVAWQEGNGKQLIHASRLNGSTWEQVGNLVVNHDISASTDPPHIANVDGKPWVAYTELDGKEYHVYVSSLSADETHWVEPGTQPLVLDQNDTVPADEVYAFQEIGGVPMVAWVDYGVPGGSQARVAGFGETPQATAPPTISGTPKPGNELTCTNGTWGSGPDTNNYTYTWERALHDTPDSDDKDWHAIDNASGDHYTAQEEDVGSRVRCRVVADGRIFSGEATSTGLQVNHGPPVLQTPPQVVGRPFTGTRLRCDPGTWTEAPDFTYTWLRNGAVLHSATGQRYTTESPDDDDDAISCQVTAHNDLGSASAHAANTLHVVARPPKNLSRPALTQVGGSENPVGRVLHCNPGRWQYDYGQYRFFWYRDNKQQQIAGAATNRYTTTLDDLGHEIYCAVFSTNPVGRNPFAATSNRILVPLPVGIGQGKLLTSGGQNEFDPVNALAISDPWDKILSPLAKRRFQRAVDEEATKCRARGDIPPQSTWKGPKASDLRPIDDFTRCAILLDRPNFVLVNSFGVHYTGQYFKDGTAVHCDPGVISSCPDLGFSLDAITPGKQGALPPGLKLRLALLAPVRILYDMNGDHKVDADCPAGSPVVRTIYDKGTYFVHALILTANSEKTGEYFDATGLIRTAHEGAGQGFGKLRPAQPFVCRPSADRPPDPEKQPCQNTGTIGRVQITGNICPIYLRSIPPDDLKGLPDEVRQVLDALNQQIGINQASLDDSVVHVPPDTQGPTAQPLSAATTGQDLAEQPFPRKLTDEAIATINGEAAKSSMEERSLSPYQLLLAHHPEVAQELGKIPDRIDPKRANLALDQIYIVKGTLTVNGTTLVPKAAPEDGHPEELPTLITPSDAGNAAPEGAEARRKPSAGRIRGADIPVPPAPQPKKFVKSMVLNNPEVKTYMGAAQEVPLAAKGAVKSELKDVKNQAESELRKAINIDQLRKDLKKKASDEFDKLDKALGPLKLAGTEAKVDLNDDGTATLHAQARLPFLSEPPGVEGDDATDNTADDASDDSPGDQTGPEDDTKKKKDRDLHVNITLKGDQQGKLTLEGVHLEAPLAELGVLTLRKVLVDYNHGLTVKGEITFPPTGEGIRINNFQVTDQGHFKALDVDYLAGAGGGIPIGSAIPLYLTALGGGVNLGPPATFDLGATFAIGPNITNRCAVVALDARANVKIGNPVPQPYFIATAHGAVKIACIPLGTVAFYANSDGKVTLDEHVNFKAGPVHVEGGFNAGIDWPNWMGRVYGDGGIDKVPFLDHLAVEALISNKGLAGCGTWHTPFGDISGGAAIHFDGDLPPVDLLSLIANIELFTGCDLSEFRTVQIETAALHAASVNGPSVDATGFKVQKSPRALALSFEGAGAAPHVRLRSPAGKLYDFRNAIAKPVSLPDAFGQVIPSEDRTFVVLAHPQPGTWTVTTDKGSPRVNRIQMAHVLAKADVKGHVSGHGSSRTLAYSIRPIKGQLVEFLEDANGSLKRIGRVRGGGRGKIHYVTGEAASDRRTIYAEVWQNGLPRKRLAIAHYIAPNPKIGRPGHVRVRRVGRRVVVSWTPARLAKSYQVGVTDTTGGQYALPVPAGKTRVTIPDVVKAEGLHVVVTGISAAGHHGPPGTVGLKAKKPKHHHHGHHKHHQHGHG